LKDRRPVAPKVFYNEFDPFAAAWLRELMADGLIPEGIVDERSIEELTPQDVEGFDQCHFFAGIGGWAYALDLAGWNRPVWTGSCPCQPLSGAGQRKGHADSRHLWPTFFDLIAKCKPAAVFGEQVASSDGREWLSGVRADLEALGYACGAADLCAAGIGAPHIRQRLYWVAHTNERQRGSWGARPGSTERTHAELTGRSALIGMGLTDGRRCKSGHLTENMPASGSEQTNSLSGTGPTNGLWASVDWLGCRDGKWRPVEPGTFPLVDGVSNRVGTLRGAGNAIVPQLAAAFIQAFASMNTSEGGTP
jgi:DNA (cytosine-5)-methyltransferase 1